MDHSEEEEILWDPFISDQDMMDMMDIPATTTEDGIPPIEGGFRNFLDLNGDIWDSEITDEEMVAMDIRDMLGEDITPTVSMPIRQASQIAGYISPLPSPSRSPVHQWMNGMDPLPISAPLDPLYQNIVPMRSWMDELEDLDKLKEMSDVIIAKNQTVQAPQPPPVPQRNLVSILKKPLIPQMMKSQTLKCSNYEEPKRDILQEAIAESIGDLMEEFNQDVEEGSSAFETFYKKSPFASGKRKYDDSSNPPIPPPIPIPIFDNESVPQATTSDDTSKYRKNMYICDVFF